MNYYYRHARRVLVFIIGSTVLLVGIAMILLPGPALLVIPSGLGILALEFAWARRLLKHIREKVDGVRNQFNSRPEPPSTGQV